MVPQLPVTVRVADGNWGGSRVADVEAVARSVADTFREALTGGSAIHVTLEPTATEKDNPITLATKNEGGDFVVCVNVRGNLWARLAYQFAHEFCHVLADSTTWTQDRFAWIEEVLCETASLFALRSMASTWSTNPPYPNWTAYSSELREYATERISLYALVQTEFSSWLAERLPLLEADPLRRDDNTAIAVRLLPLFESGPTAWETVRHLHTFRRNTALGLPHFMEAWRREGPVENGIFVDQIAGLLGS